MKILTFEGSTTDCSFTYTRTREGPNFFISHYKGSTRGHNDPKECWRTLGVAKFTDTGKALKEWCLLMDETYGVEDKPESRSDTSFASEILEESNDNTRMVT